MGTTEELTVLEAGVEEVTAALCALSPVTLARAVVVVGSAGPPKLGRVRVSIVEYVVPSITPVNGIVRVDGVGVGLSWENEERLIGASDVGEGEVVEERATFEFALTLALAVAEGEGVSLAPLEALAEALEALAEAEAEAVSTAALDTAPLAEAEAEADAASTALGLALAVATTGPFVPVGTPPPPPNASAGTRIVIVRQSPSSSPLSALTFCLTPVPPPVGRALGGRVRVIVTSPTAADGVDVGTGEMFEVGKTVVADASEASRLGKGEFVGMLAGADTEETASEGVAVGRAEISMPGAVGRGTAPCAWSKTLSTDEVAAVEGEAKSLGTGGATGIPALFVSTLVHAAVTSVAVGATSLATIVAEAGVGTPTFNCLASITTLSHLFFSADPV